MRFPAFRTISILVLLLAVVMLSGVTTAVSAAGLEKGANACCDREESESHGETSPSPCSTVDCPCPACLIAEPVKQPAVHPHSFELICHPFLPSGLRLKMLVVPIEYPPEKSHS